jgi:hypothetical protein
MQKWEYMVLERLMDTKQHIRLTKTFLSISSSWLDDPNDSRSMSERLNALGQDGWDLISAYPKAQISGDAWSGVTSSQILILKRPKE